MVVKCLSRSIRFDSIRFAIMDGEKWESRSSDSRSIDEGWNGVERVETREVNENYEFLLLSTIFFSFLAVFFFFL